MKWTGGSKERLKSKGGSSSRKWKGSRRNPVNDIFFASAAGDNNKSSDTAAQNGATSTSVMSAASGTVSDLFGSSKRKKLTESHLASLSQWSQAAGLSLKPNVPLPIRDTAGASLAAAANEPVQAHSSLLDPHGSTFSNHSFRPYATGASLPGPSSSGLITQPPTMLLSESATPTPPSSRFVSKVNISPLPPVAPLQPHQNNQPQFVQRKVFEKATGVSGNSLMDELRSKSQNTMQTPELLDNGGKEYHSKLEKHDLQQRSLGERDQITDSGHIRGMDEPEDVSEAQPPLRVSFSPGKESFFEQLAPSTKSQRPLPTKGQLPQKTEQVPVLFWNEGKLVHMPELGM